MGFWDAITSAASAVGQFAADHWKEAAAIAVGTVVFAGVIVLTGGTAALLAPTLLQLAAAGIASGMASQVTADLLDGRTPDVSELAKAAVVGGVITVATAGVGRFVPGLATPLANQAAQRAVVATAGGAGGAGAQMLSNAIDGRPLMDNVEHAAISGAIATTLGNEGLRVLAPRIVTGPGRGSQQTPPRGREIVPEPEPDALARLFQEATPPRLTRAEAEAIANDAARARAQELRSPGGEPLTGRARDDVPRGVSAFTDRVTGETTVGVTGGPLNERMAQAFRDAGIDLPAIQQRGDARALYDAMRNPTVREALNPRIADAVLAKGPESLTMRAPNGETFLALPWNCAEIQAYNAALARGSRPENLVADTVTARENNPANAGRPFKSCPNCENVLHHQGVFNASDARIAAGTVTSDTTAPGGVANAPAPADPRAKGILRALGGGD